MTLNHSRSAQPFDFQSLVQRAEPMPVQNTTDGRPRLEQPLFEPSQDFSAARRPMVQ